MKELIKKFSAVAVFAIIFISVAGCEEQQKTSNTKKDRVFAAQNIELKGQLERCNNQVAKLLEEKETLRESHQKAIKDMTENVFIKVLDENKALRDENEALKSQIEQRD